MEMHPDEEVIYQGHPSWRSTFSFYARGTIVAAIAAAIAAVVTLIGDGIDWLLVVLIFLGGTALTVLVGFIRRMFTVYTITNQRLRIQRGIIARNVQQTRIERVQNVNTEQGVIDRMLRVGAVDFDTAGTTDSDFRFDGVDHPEDVVAAVDKAQREHTRMFGTERTDGL
ncbi:MAG: PH domain-containing protein [Solirubrobacterales bacterium]